MQVTFLAESDWTGFEFIEFMVNDTEFNVTDNMRVDILPVNDPPTITLPDDFTFDEDQALPVDFNLYVNDVDDDPLTITVSGNENISIFFDGLAATLVGDLNWFGQETLVFTVDDNINLAAVDVGNTW
jgi:hypothetical protein